MAAITAASVVTPSGTMAPAIVELDGALIAAVTPLRAEGPVPERTLVPGFVDLQVNGIDDIDVATASGADWTRLGERLLAQGTTTWCPTLVTSSLDTYPARFAEVQRAAAVSAAAGGLPAIAGIHLEGPFLGGAPGAHRADLVTGFDRAFLASLPDIVRLVTLAPELPGAPEVIADLVARGVRVGLGHTLASTAELDAAAAAGARFVTHLYNAMSGLHHRDPGVAGWALTEDRVTCGLIVDGVHVHPMAVKLAFRAKGASRVALVTDAVAWQAGTRGADELALVDGAPRLADGTLAGSTLTMDAAVRVVVERCGVSFTDAVRAAATTPARVLGLEDRGAIEPGRRADLVALDADGRVEAVWVAGVQVR